MPRFLIAPGLVEQREPYALLTRDAELADAHALLRCLGPRPPALAACSVEEVLDGSTPRVVVCSLDWRAQVSRLAAAGFDPSRVDVLLTPEGNPWGYVDFVRSLAGWPERDGVRQIRPSEAVAHLGRSRKFVVVADEVVEADKDALTLLRSAIAQNSPAWDEVRRLLADDESRRAWDLLARGTPTELFSRFAAESARSVQYFDLLRRVPGMVVVNGGVQEGFELPYFLELVPDARVVSVDPSGFDRLTPLAASSVAAAGPARAPVVPVALWRTSGRVVLPVAPSGAVLSQYHERNVHGLEELELECRRVDDLVEELSLDRVDVIKLDVEGAEPAVLDGMGELLGRHRPQLLVSIYHWPEHMWELPRMLAAGLTDYDFFVRHHSYGRWECVLYAIPRELRHAPRVSSAAR